MNCPQCDSDTGMKYPRYNTPYCEECGYPEDNWEPAPDCVICKKPGVGICGEQWRCEEHWFPDSPLLPTLRSEDGQG